MWCKSGSAACGFTAAAMWWLLAGVPSVGTASTGCVLVAAPASVAASNPLAERAEDAGHLPIDRSRQRAAADRQWYEQSAMGDLLGEDFDLVQKDNLYRCLD
jgi:hypothetical protein